MAVRVIIDLINGSTFATRRVIFRSHMLILLAALLVPFALSPVTSPVQWSFAAETLPNAQVRIDMKASIESGWHVYATALPSDEGPLPTVVEIDASEHFTLVGKVHEPEAEQAYDPNFAMDLWFHSGQPVFSQLIARKTTGAFTVTGSVEYMVCNDKTCLPPVKVPITVEIPALEK
jgi:thiol:disulfide interchange protein DsbD